MCERTIAKYEEELCCVKMCERTIAEYKEELSRTKEENERLRQLLEAVFKKPQVVLHRTDVQQPPHIKKEEEDPQPPHMKEEEEEVWMSQEGECPVGQEEADVSKFPLTVVSVKTEEHEDKPPESSQLHHSPSSQCCGERASLAEGTSTSRAGVLGVQTTRSRAQGLLHDGGGAGNAGCRAASTRPRSRRDVLRPALEILRGKMMKVTERERHRRRDTVNKLESTGLMQLHVLPSIKV
ncbi:uncharacterized protein LOC133537307 isoform X10 [Nerophis ophidion]|uniref:uncharacterized protein LOC133537307 isoform X10 n=1 Tax=Nerophis ophidion TaxID=159077 RepID=UPI002ADFA1DD|nr:uncharacterized protein LOC133537307 isoform X10 [Nerophis ophidion]